MSSCDIPFRVGIDYAGHITTCLDTPGNQLSLILTFVCLCALEAVTDFTTEAFLAALKHFTRRRVVPNEIHSDNCSNFVGSSGELQEL